MDASPNHGGDRSPQGLTLPNPFHRLSLLLIVLWLVLGVSALSHAQRFVRPINTIDALIASNPNDPHTNVFIPQGPGGPGIFYQWRKNDTTATNDNQSVLGTDWPGAVGRWLKIPIQQGSVGGNTGISNPGTNGFAVVNTLADLRNIPGNLGIGMVYIRGHSQAYDWGQGFFSRVDDCSTPDDDGLTSAHGNDELTCWTRENRFPWSGTPVQYAGGTVTRTLINTVSQYLSTQGGGTVFITDGAWAMDTTNGPIILRNSVTIAGSASAMLVGDGYGTMFGGTNIHNAQILEVGISNVVTGVLIRGGTNILIGGNSFFDFDEGVRQYGGDDVRIEVNRFAEGTNAIRLSLDGAVKVTQGALIGNTFSGIVNSNILEDVGSIDGYQLLDNGPNFRLPQLLSALWAGTNGFLTIGTGTPEGVLARDPGSLFLRRDTGDVYRKSTGTGNTGWVALGSGGSTTINTTDERLPYRQNSTTFGDSPWHRISTNKLGFNGSSLFLFNDSSFNLFQGGGGSSLSSGVANISLGALALNSVTSGNGNTGLGVDAGLSITSGGQNTLIGGDSGNDITSGSYNVLIGYFAGDNISTIDSIVGVGSFSLIAQTKNFNTALGQNAGSGTVDVGGNPVNGSESGTFIGYSAGNGINNGTNSVIIGALAGNRNSPSNTNVHESVVIGGAAAHGITNLVSSVVIGSLSATNGVSGLTNVIVIGHAVEPQGNNTAQIGTNGVTVLYLNGTVGWFRGTGSPEGVVTAPIGSFYSREDGGAATSFYVKESGTGNTGWVAK